MPRGRVTNHFRHIANLFCLCAVISLSGCLESDEPVTILPSDLLQIEGLNSVWQFDSEKKQYLQLVLLKDRHYEYNSIGLENGVVGKAALYDLAFIPLSVQEPGVEHYLGIARHLDEKEPNKLNYSYVELRRTQNQFSWRPPDLPGQIWSRVNVRLDRNQGGRSHAQETLHARRDHPTSADG